MINITIRKSDIIRQSKIFGICLVILFLINHFGEFSCLSEMDEYESERWRNHIEYENRNSNINNGSVSLDNDNYTPTKEELDLSTPEGKLYAFKQVPKNTRGTGEVKIVEPFVSSSSHRNVYNISFKPILGSKVSTGVFSGIKEYDILYLDSKYSNFTYPKRLILYLKSTLVNAYWGILFVIVYNLFYRIKKNIRIRID